ncbi:MAG: TldD/PmbA family protein, partial [Actinomycetota bacterium]|nr:TldD/PmbA family protein [Actinomycetota bacterium]
MRDVARAAIDEAVFAGARYADARALTRRAQSVSTRNRELESISDGDSEGIGVRVLVDGAWGFACDRRLSTAGARDAARRAVGFARASSTRAS